MRFLSLLFIACGLLVLIGCKSTTLEQQYKNQNDKQIFQRAEHELATKNYENAAKGFEALDTLYPFGDYSQQAQLDIIYAYYKHDDADSALAAADRYIRLYPRSDDVDYAFYMKGLINMGAVPNWVDHFAKTDVSQRDANGMAEAFQNFGVLIQRFPDSKYVPDAKKRMAYIRNLLAQHNLEIAQFYLKRKTYVAAVNRATQVVQDYPGAPQVIPALAVMVQAYRGLNETELANQTLKILTTNYPNSPEVKRLQRN